MIVTLQFDLAEEVTADLFARKVALACGYGGALRKGEAVICDGVPYTVYERPADPNLPWEVEGAFYADVRRGQ